MVFCPMRILPCEPGMHACNRPLHAWFHVEVEAQDEPTFVYDEEDEQRFLQQHESTREAYFQAKQSHQQAVLQAGARLGAGGVEEDWQSVGGDFFGGEEEGNGVGGGGEFNSSFFDGGSTILSYDGKSHIAASETDLLRAGLRPSSSFPQSPSNSLSGGGSGFGTTAGKGAGGRGRILSKAEIARQVAQTDLQMRQLLPPSASDPDPFAEKGAATTLFASKQVNIQYNKKGTFFESIRVQRADKVNSPRGGRGHSRGGGGGNMGTGDDNSHSVFFGAHSLSSDSSVYHDGFEMKFHHHLRLHVCHLHKQSMIFSALRHNDFPLMEHIAKQIKESADIDFEDIYGDTALTLACRSGKLNFIELLVEHSADVNIETSNGRTREFCFCFVLLCFALFCYLFFLLCFFVLFCYFLFQHLLLIFIFIFDVFLTRIVCLFLLYLLLLLQR
jgi:hypothetical protein